MVLVVSWAIRLKAYLIRFYSIRFTIVASLGTEAIYELYIYRVGQKHRTVFDSL